MIDASKSNGTNYLAQVTQAIGNRKSDQGVPAEGIGNTVPTLRAPATKRSQKAGAIRHPSPNVTGQATRQAKIDKPAQSQIGRTQFSLRKFQSIFVRNTGDRVFFDIGSGILTPQADRALRVQAHWLDRHKQFTVEIVGHADDPGNQSLNDRVAVRRAQAVHSALISYGISSERLSLRSIGRIEPIANCDSEDCARQNRRVTLRLGYRRVNEHEGRSASWTHQ
ncbi:MAG: OmpA family protein [Hyphomicrobiaceae bacterium]